MSKILILTNSIGGLYNFRYELVERLIEEGYEVIISSPYGNRIEEFLKIGCKHYDISLNRHGKNPIEDIKVYLEYKRIILDIKPKYVLGYTIKPNIYGSIAARKCGVAFIANITGLGTALEKQGLTQKLLILMYKYAFREIKKVFFQNKSNMNFFKNNKIAIGKHELLPGSGVNIDKFSLKEYPNDDIIKFAFIGRIMKEKGIDYYLEAAKFIRNRYENTEFHVCGSFEEDYERILEEYENKGIIIYNGVINNMPDFLKSIHGVIHPSYYPEGMSNVLLESCASGRPIITTDRPGCREIVEDGVNGYLIPIKNSSCLINKIEKFLSLSSKDREKMGINARKKVEKEFDRKIVINKYLELLE